MWARGSTRLFLTSAVLLLAEPALAQEAPRPISPPTASVVGSARPMLQTSMVAAEIVACRDRALRRGCVRWAPDGERATPPSDLARGLWFWRASDGGPTWSFAVARVSTGAQRHHAVDFDADGFDDLAAVVPFSRQRGAEVSVQLLRGSAAGLDARTPTVLRGIGTSEHRGVTLAAGDLDGDGRTDLVIGAPEEGSDEAGVVRVFRAGPRRFGTRPSLALTGEAARAHLGAALAIADADGDGFEDVAIATGASVRVHRGTASGVTSTAAWTIAAASAVSALAWGDVNADGFADLAVAAPFASSEGHTRNGEVSVFLGGAASLATSPVVVLTGPHDGDGFGGALSVGDVDGDGDGDLVVGSPTASDGAQLGGAVSVHRGVPTGVESAPVFRYAHGELADGAGWDVATGDVDGDGRDEILAGAPNAMGIAPAGFVAHAGLAFVIEADSTSAPLRARGLSQADLFGRAVAMLDVNGDGFLDALVSSIGNGYDLDGAVLVFPGSPTGVSTTPSVLRPGPSGALFGSDLAR